MAMHAHAFLTAETQGFLDGVTSQKTVGGLNVSDSTEIYYWEFSTSAGRSKSDRKGTGRAQIDPIIFRKPYCKASPLMMKAMDTTRSGEGGEKINGTFKFFRPCDDGGGYEHYFSVTIRNGRLISRFMCSPDSSDPGAAETPDIEEWHMTAEDVEFECLESGRVDEIKWEDA